MSEMDHNPTTFRKPVRLPVGSSLAADWNLIPPGNAEYRSINHKGSANRNMFMEWITRASPREFLLAIVALSNENQSSFYDWST
jgi:hypothetical protein